MQEGWYCRSLASEQASSQQDEPTDPNADDDSGSDDSQDQDEVSGREGSAPVDYKTQYRYMKHKLKFLIYENEFFQDALRSNQRRLLKVSRDRAFLLDRLLQYEKAENSSSESEKTESSEDEAVKEAKKRKLDNSANNGTSGSQRGRKRKTPAPPTTDMVAVTTSEQPAAAAGISEPTMATAEVMPPLEIEPQQGHMTAAEIERHLQSRQPAMMDLMTERAPATVPAEMFSNEPSLDSEATEHLMDGSSPTHVAAEECVPMEYSN